ncbi:MAG: nucleoside triphosphate pyrophosphohydrolase [Candidatus Margulisbacteria bacterium]|jgi:MazG family protein|nr:nucleoside triphosphate pyrophosphohydrolase [Candidatus Margulisiibacteriota bacterium]
MQQFREFVEIVRKLRRECPWDREQTFATLKPYLVEEVYEALEAIDNKDYGQLAEELGDMLLHVVMLSVFAEQAKKFTIDDVIGSIAAKMVRRHPHVFGQAEANDKAKVWRNWEKIKGEEKRGKGQGSRGKGMLESIPRSLPALYRADKVQRRAARVGFDWDQVAGAWDKVHEELDEVHELLNSKVKIKKSKLMKGIKEELGDLLFAIVNVARKLELDPEETLQEANGKFIRRFAQIEKVLQKKKLTLKQMDALWDKAKAAEK